MGVGLDIDKFQKIQPISEYTYNTNNILYVGTDEKRKRVDYIIKVFQAICSERKDIHLIIVGDISRNRRSQLLNRVEPQYRGCIEFLGKVENTKMGDIYRNSICSVLASDEEIFGMVVLESMYFGVPCIAHSVAGPKTVIDDRVDGFLESNYDLGCWKVDFECLIDNIKIREQMGRAARRKVLQCFTWDKVAHKMMIKMKEMK